MTDDATANVAQIINGLDPGAIVTRFVVVAEIISNDGERGLWTATHDGATRWDTYGLLHYAIQAVRTHHAADYVDDD